MYPANVANKRIFGFFEEKVAMNYQIKTNPEFEGLAIHSFTLSEENVYFGTSKQLDKNVYDKIVNAFNELEADGSLKLIREKY